MLQKFLSLLFLLLVVACGEDAPNGFTLGQEGQGEQPSPPPVPPTSLVRDAARLEMPKLTGAASELFVVHRTAPSRPQADSVVNFAYAYDVERMHSRWVAFRFDSDTRPRVVGRKDYTIRPKYPIDPKLPVRYALPSDLTFNGYDHGHLCASADRLYSREANDQTFYMSNMSPQTGYFNQQYWTAFEEHVQTLGRDASFADTLYVVKGGTIAEERGILGYLRSARVPIPKYYYMALLKVKNGVYTSLGFWVEHKDYGRKGNKSVLRQHVVSIQELQQHTGIDFFHNLDDRVESKVEAASPFLSSWRI